MLSGPQRGARKARPIDTERIAVTSGGARYRSRIQGVRRRGSTHSMSHPCPVCRGSRQVVGIGVAALRRHRQVVDNRCSSPPLASPTGYQPIPAGSRVGAQRRQPPAMTLAGERGRCPIDPADHAYRRKVVRWRRRDPGRVAKSFSFTYTRLRGNARAVCRHDACLSRDSAA